MSLERWERSRERRKRKAKARLAARRAAGLPRQLPQFDNKDEAPELGYHELKCEGFREWIGGEFVQHACGRVVFAPRQASMCAACAKASRALHMRKVRAKAKRPIDFGNCRFCKAKLKDAKRTSRKYCGSECRQAAYRARIEAASA